MNTTKILVTFLPLMLISSFSSLTIAGGYNQLPRGFGPFEIGMTRNEFIELTGVAPEACDICIKNESFASLGDKQLKKFEVSAEGIDFFFFNDSLYHIALGPKEKDLFTVQQDYESRFGGPGTPIAINGKRVLKWEDPGTVVTMNYREKDKEVYSINLYDWNLKEERDWRESISSTQTPATATLD